jgi:hypothetical protein
VDALSQGLKTLGYKMDRAYGSMWMRNVGMLVFVLVGVHPPIKRLFFYAVRHERLVKQNDKKNLKCVGTKDIEVSYLRHLRNMADWFFTNLSLLRS